MENQETPFTFGGLKLFLETLSPEQLQQQARVSFDDEATRNINGGFVTDHDVYALESDYDECGSLEELKDMRGDEFIESDYILVTPKGSVALW